MSRVLIHISLKKSNYSPWGIISHKSLPNCKRTGEHSHKIEFSVTTICSTFVICPSTPNPPPLTSLSSVPTHCILPLLEKWLFLPILRDIAYFKPSSSLPLVWTSTVSSSLYSRHSNLLVSYNISPPTSNISTKPKQKFLKNPYLITFDWKYRKIKWKNREDKNNQCQEGNRGYGYRLCRHQNKGILQTAPCT